jgi:hypothetical protein
MVYQNHKWNYIHLYLTRHNSTITHFAALHQAGNELEGSICIQGQKHALAAVVSSCGQYRHYVISPHTKTVQPMVSHGCNGWSLTPSTEQMLAVFRNRVLRVTFGPKKEVAGDWM